jgi:ribosome-binding protein aMBF1 (putative translation factor)
LLPVQCRMARTALGWGVRDLAAKADKSPNTIARFERGEHMRPDTIAEIRAALELGGVEFVAEDQTSSIGGPGVRLAKPMRRKRGK